jgi:hypothetical protein
VREHVRAGCGGYCHCRRTTLSTNAHASFSAQHPALVASGRYHLRRVRITPSSPAIGSHRRLPLQHPFLCVQPVRARSPQRAHNIQRATSNNARRAPSARARAMMRRLWMRRDGCVPACSKGERDRRSCDLLRGHAASRRQHRGARRRDRLCRACIREGEQALRIAPISSAPGRPSRLGLLGLPPKPRQALRKASTAPKRRPPKTKRARGRGGRRAHLTATGVRRTTVHRPSWMRCRGS